MASNPEVAMTLREAVQSLYFLLEGRSLELVPELDRFQSYTTAINQGLRAVAREHEWSYYSSVEDIGPANLGERELLLRSKVRARLINDDQVRFVDSSGRVRVWAAFVPRDALHKYSNMRDIKVAYTRSSLVFSRPFGQAEAGLHVQVPVMREPVMFRLPEQPHDLSAPTIEVPEDILEQEVDFDHPDLAIAKAAHMIAQTNPMYQARVQTLEAAYDDIKYALVERDERNTEAPMMNDWSLGISNAPGGHGRDMSRPRADLSPWE